MPKKPIASCRCSISRNLQALCACALCWLGCQETQELFPTVERLAPAPDAGRAMSSSVFHLISIGANAQVDGLDEVNGLGGALFLRDGELLFWGNGGEETQGRGVTVAVVDPADGSLRGEPQNFDTWATRRTDGAETQRLVTFLEQIEPGMLVLLAVGDDAGVTDNGRADVLCDLLVDEHTQRLLQRLMELGSRHIGDYCYRASWVMAAYKGKGTAEREVLNNGAPAHAAVRVTY